MPFNHFRMLRSAWCFQPRTRTAHGKTGMHLAVSWAGLFNEPVEIVQATLLGGIKRSIAHLLRPDVTLFLIDTASHSCCLKDVTNVLRIVVDTAA